MSVVDLPPGEWTPFLIGDQWPSSVGLETTLASAVQRGRLASSFETYSALLIETAIQNLAPQRGITAEESRAEFNRGVATARSIAEINRVKNKSYETVHRAVSNFQNSLRSLAAEGNGRIAKSESAAAALPDKIAEIIAIITEIRSRALLKAAACSSEIHGAIFDVLTAQGIDSSPQTFAAERGLTPPTAAPTASHDLKNQIVMRVSDRSTSTGAGLEVSSSEIADVGTATALPPLRTHATSSLPNSSVSAADIATDGTASTPNIAPATPPPSTTAAVTDIATGSPVPTPNTPAYSGRNTDLAIAQPLSTPVAGATAGTPTHATAPTASVPSSGAVQPPARLPADQLVESLDTGIQTGAPVSASAEAFATAAVTPVHTAPPPLSTSLETIAPAPPVFETAHAVSPQGTDLAHVGPVSADVAPPVIAPTPPAAVAPVIAPPVSAGPVVMPSPTPLIAYGADLRPPAVAAAAAPPVNVAAPGSAPINPSGSAAPTGQPTVVRQQHSAATPLAVAAGLTEQAVAAATGGAAVGAAAARTEAENRLRRLLAAVARQQPQLRWAIGILDNGDTVLATDLAGGWLPPHIDVPVGVKLLRPTAHRRNLAALLGAATLTAHYEPGQYLSPAAEPVAMSIRARDTAPVEDLGWALSQATKWRDGLPRLAHTLAKAITAQTGFLDSEVVLLREHLRAVERTVLVKYPANVNPAEVANWQLLATIAALLDNDRRLANYHFDWFQTQALPRGGYR